MKKEIRFGLIGLGLMGREFASAAMRWSHLTDLDVRPVLTAACDTNEGAFGWFKQNVSTLEFTTTDYHAHYFNARMFKPFIVQSPIICMPSSMRTLSGQENICSGKNRSESIYPLTVKSCA
jgi:hypothetical protein